MADPLPALSVVTSHQLSQHLVLARKRAKMTQSEVAGWLALSQNPLSHLERHPEEFSFAQLLSYCAAVGLQIQLSERAKETDSSVEEW